jgi:hypothetical protein
MAILRLACAPKCMESLKAILTGRGSSVAIPDDFPYGSHGSCNPEAIVPTHVTGLAMITGNIWEKLYAQWRVYRAPLGFGMLQAWSKSAGVKGR